MNKLLLLFIILPLSIFSQQQNTLYKAEYFQFKKAATFSVQNIEEDWNATIQHLELPKPGTPRGNLQILKKQQRENFPIKNTTSANRIHSADSPTLGANFEGNTYNNSVPNDNDIAVSNDGYLVSVKNTNVWAYNLNTNSLIFQKTLANFTQPLSLGGTQYDPKVVYDPENNRFIVVILRGYTYQSSWIIVAFSSTSNPADPWHFYKLKGNPLNNNTWSDYPVIGINQNELFIGINTFYNGSQNNSGFKESCLWQIDKTAGFSGDTTLSTKYYHDILKPTNDSIFNITPIKGGSTSYGPNMYCLSNKNLKLENDTFYLLEITGKVNDANTEMKITTLKTDKKYFLPVSAIQANGHTFDTNDSRILGGLYEDGRIQFVQSTTDTSNGRSAIYHGFINTTLNPISCTGNIISENGLDYGYPNISYTGKKLCDNEALITFNHTDSTVFSGASAIFFSNELEYSNRLTIKTGDNYVNVLSGVYERWGDYSGSQRIYNHPGKVFMAGSFGKTNNTNGTWLAEILSPSTSASNPDSLFAYTSTPTSSYGACDGMISNLVPLFGYQPYTYLWDFNSSTSTTIENLCTGNYTVSAWDKYNCKKSDTLFVGQGNPVNSVFPNPVLNEFSVFFEMPATDNVSVKLYDRTGKLVKTLYEGTAKKGRNLFSFSTHNVSSGTYILRIDNNQTNLLKEKMVKQ
ncbi:MAG: T9SS type A sorting domain-containing protein [Flavobacteriales bacterium]|nr:T9SS type A sorting domain-containing protein [Flavobacteriales bacterium]